MQCLRALFSQPIIQAQPFQRFLPLLVRGCASESIPEEGAEEEPSFYMMVDKFYEKAAAVIGVHTANQPSLAIPKSDILDFSHTCRFLFY